MNNALKTTLVAVLAMFGIQAHAALPAEVGTAFTSLQTDADALLALAWPVITAIVVGFILIKLFKRAANKV